MEDGFILRVCAKAIADPGNVNLVLLDELNRANVPKVLGDLLTTMDPEGEVRTSATTAEVQRDGARAVK